ncbi:SDR family NAD(P)-dependent oxidoreductase [Echinicola jeungdonensis]|uniref:SDR family oxidoreductase n=1 Tax=Echinicola jeungdonensis TaxID=709343 RepID=A0ABV5J7M0_9BACT|nr:SDR family NAD(P)-dependent oxidoreductase [Echinicola jeungdonensis]MDN3669717.1 SDR family NAD(P)-dependent oxidoreductase [Echinicola jeungdonensis]
MNLQNNTILITGGSSGIGLELAKSLAKKNKILICGRSKGKLEEAKAQIPGSDIFPCDLSLDLDRKNLFEWVKEKHPECNMLVNNAALVHRTHFARDEQMQDKAGLEIQTNLVAPIMLTKLFLPLLEQKKYAGIVNITSGLVYAPKREYPIYNCTKAGLHSFTQTLRMQLGKSGIKIIEVLMPVVDTPWHDGKVPKMAISAEEAVGIMIKGLAQDETEIRVGKVKLLYWLNRIAPKIASKVINGGN